MDDGANGGEKPHDPELWKRVNRKYGNGSPGTGWAEVLDGDGRVVRLCFADGRLVGYEPGGGSATPRGSE